MSLRMALQCQQQCNTAAAADGGDDGSTVSSQPHLSEATIVKPSTLEPCCDNLKFPVMTCNAYVRRDFYYFDTTLHSLRHSSDKDLFQKIKEKLII